MFLITWLLQADIYSKCSYWKGNTFVVPLHVGLSSEQQFFALVLYNVFHSRTDLQV